jgi:hypothetical protein
MTDYKPQDTPGVIKRLNFESIGGNDYSRYTRTQKGITREIVTPKLSVPLSREGSTYYQYVDKNDVIAAIQARNVLIRLIVFWYPVVKLQKALLSYISNNTIVKQLFQTKFNRDAETVSPETYTNG